MKLNGFVGVLGLSPIIVSFVTVLFSVLNVVKVLGGWLI